MFLENTNIIKKFGQLGPFFPDVKTTFCAYDRKKGIDGDNDDYINNHDSNDDSFDDNDKKLPKSIQIL